MISPFGNTTVLPAAMWHPEATQRGTFGILSSCLITMSLCIWTAVHLNLPEHKKESQQVYRKTLWLALGLFAPEVVVWSAWRQRKDMKSLSAKMNSLEFMAEGYEPEGWVGKLFTKIKVFLLLKAGDLSELEKRDWFAKLWTKIKVLLLLEAEDLPELEEPCEPKELRHDRRHPWTDVHSWYTVMGGLAFEDTAAEELQFMPGNRSRLTLTDEVVIWMAENRPGLLPDISRQHIEDKSKSGGLGKFLTCWQASYFCIQCVFRLSQSYSISLLELNVFAHALCALLLFRIWWDKPQDVLEPTLITDEAGLDVCAYLTLNEFGNVHWRRLWIPCEPCSNTLKMVAPAAVATTFQGEEGYGSNVLLAFGPNRQPCLEVLGSFWTIHTNRFHWHEGETLELDSRAIRQLKRAYDLAFANRIAERRAIGVVLVDRCADLVDNWNVFSVFRRFDYMAISNWFSSRLWLAFGLTLAGGCYGGLHLTAWTCQFPSYAETMLWRAASITILATGPSVIAFVLCISTTNDIDYSGLHWLQARQAFGAAGALDSVMSITRHVEKTLFLLWALWYTLCRVFIVVECFIMLAHLPESTLDIPTWARYIPHIT